MQDAVWLRRHVGELTDQQERREAQPWAVSDAPERYVEVMLRGIVGFRFDIARLEGKWKMSQNREMKDRAGVVQGLDARSEGDDAEVAALAKDILAAIEKQPLYYTDIAERFSSYDFRTVARALGHLHATEKLWQDPRGKMCVRGSDFAAKPPRR